MKQTLSLALSALAGWALCGGVMAAGMRWTSLETALWVHLAAAPVIFHVLSEIHFKRFPAARPLRAAAAFAGIVIGLDFFVAALAVQRSLDMFKSPVGTWLPFALIFLSVWTTGASLRRRKKRGKQS